MPKLLSWCRGLLFPKGESPKQIARDMGITIALLGMAAVVCAWLNMLGHSDSAVPLVFVLAVLLTARFTEGYFYGMFASVASVIGVNYAFTYPYFQFNFTLTGYPFTFVTMFAVSMVVGMLTERVKRQERLRSIATQEKMKANLLRSVSHDIRTPLTSIIGSSNVVLEHYDTLNDDEKKELINHVREDAQWLVRLVENILSITRINDAAVRLKKCPEAAEEIVSEAVSTFRKNRSMPVHVRVPDELLMVPMDATLIELHVTKESNRMVRFCVEDNGLGIDAEVLPKLFEELFPHAQNENADGRRNMGIGLSACMSIVRAHGGVMRAENREAGGARVCFELPMEEENTNGG